LNRRRCRGCRWLRRRLRWRCYHYGRRSGSRPFCCGRLCLNNGLFRCRWSYHHRLFNWRDNGRRRNRRLNDPGLFLNRRLSNWSRSRRLRFRRGNRWRRGHCSRRTRGRGRMMLLLLFLFEQPHYVTRFGDLGEVNLGFDLGRSAPLPGTCGAGFGSKMSPDLLSCIFLN
jgi:hypothetical protein